MNRGTTDKGAIPLDLARTSYSYVERPNPAIVALLERHVLAVGTRPRILDIGCGCGANARAFKRGRSNVHVFGVEPNAQAALLARRACDGVFHGTFEDWAARSAQAEYFDVLVLSDVLEHVADPIAFVRSIRSIPALEGALWIVSVPNYAVWYNRLRTLLGVQSYAWSGLWDRTHLRFFTRRSARQLLAYCGLAIVDEASTPSLVQSTATVLRKLFERDVVQGDHLALADSRAYEMYRTLVEPVESRVCGVWPELLAFQVVYAARAPGAGRGM
jgi:2-polyprenyl-3-methyl-5-hydroxy-6-metoxy-1,4-benzoquinol methylase